MWTIRSNGSGYWLNRYMELLEIPSSIFSAVIFMRFEELPATFMHYWSWGRSAISISWSDFPLVSTTFLFTNATAIKQNVAKPEYRSWGPIFSNSCRKSNPTKKFITWKALMMDQWTTGSARNFELQIELPKVITFLYKNELNCPPVSHVWNNTNPAGKSYYLATNLETLWDRKTSLSKVEASMGEGSNKTTKEVKYYPMHRHADRHSFCPYPTGENFW